ncbi:MAG: transcriptional regulator [Nanoarchaeota archaeon]|nr:transcriptional regulator [Nanoarchaeota archaeon]MBU4086983.1 transcriptional regulator [Nanoarchaeota archaeon]
MYSLPQEIEVWYIIPAVRREFARVLVEKHELTMEKAGEIIGVTKAAVSQYLKNKRAGLFKIPKSIKREIEKSAEVIVREKNLAVREIMRILEMVKTAKCSCEICKKYNSEITKMCGMNGKY